MVELTTLLGLTQTIAIIIGVIIAVAELRHMRQTRDTELETRQAQLFTQLFSIYDTRDFLEDYIKATWVFEYEDLSDWEKKYGPSSDIAAHASWLRVGRFFDGVGILLKKNLIDVNLVTELLREPIVYSWEKMRPWVIEARQVYNPEIWENFEYLYGEVRIRTSGRESLP